LERHFPLAGTRSAGSGPKQSEATLEFRVWNPGSSVSICGSETWQSRPAAECPGQPKMPWCFDGQGRDRVWRKPGVATVLVRGTPVGPPLDLRWTTVGPPPGFRQHHGVSTESEGGFDSIGVAAIQGKPHFRATSIPSGDFATLVVLKRSGLWTLDFGHWAFGPLPASAASQPSTIVGPQTC